MADQSQQDRPNEALLLKKYELCRGGVQNLESTVWKTATVFGVGSVTAFIYLVKAQLPWWHAGVIGFLVVLTTVIWWFIARRWWSIQWVLLLRMRHIEEELHLYANRYVHFVDNPEKVCKSKLCAKHKTALLERAKQRGCCGCFREHQRFGVQQVLRCFPWLLAAVWIVYVLLCWAGS